METPKKEDILLLADEKFDFDLSLSSSSANEDDEVFFGPIGHKERCIAASLELNNQIPQEPPLPASERHFTWSPLTGEKFVEVYKEAHLLAFQIQSNGRTKAVQAAQPEDPGSQGVERFIQESKLKVNLFDRENEMKKSPKSLKRETYCLSDGLWRAPLLPGTQPTSSTALPASPAQASRPETSGMPPASCPSLPAEPSAAQPPNQAGAPKKVASKLPPPRTSSLRGKSLHSAVEKPAREKPASPPGMKIQNEKGAHSSMSPDKPSTARDVASLPASGSHLVPGKRSLPVPNKSGPKKTMLKPPGCAGGLAGRSSSGSVSGLSSASPAAGRAKPSERPGISVDSARSSSSQTGRMGHGLPRPTLKAGPGGVASRQSQRPGAAEWPAEQPRGPPRAALPQPQTPDQGGPGPRSHCGLSQSPERGETGGTVRRGSCLNSKAKAVPAPANQFKIPGFSTGKSQMNFNIPLPLPIPASSGSPTAAASAGATGQKAPRGVWQVRHLVKTADKSCWAGPSVEFLVQALLVDVKLDQLSLAVEAVATAPDDRPLIDFCRSPKAAVALPSGSGPLADLLTNTPEAPRRAAAKPPDEVGQLIDLASPLILLSPGADKENMESPLLKF
ncbi:G2 and S phase-expressed protein 1 [Cervus canadensis]|uniref:G2 and S phase-expressed protein 1 n=1 Tax=Cervus canadensis TaxID=1574408 RepID=UPI001CA3681D|nr:G2 and S phase-expressed protein 1 [Cervus canadensis]